MNLELTFKRQNLAKAYCDNLEGKGITDARSGLFLAGPRRVGKTTFLLEDLLPVINQRDWLPIYIDLWADKLSDPGLLIIEAIKRKILEYSGKLKKLSKKVALQKINLLKTIELDFSQPNMPENITLVDLIDTLINLAKKPIVLIIDEAQHVLTTKQGLNIMYAIKSARDQINLAANKMRLMLVMTGSNRDKLGQLVIKKEQPFFGSEIMNFPLLGKDFTDYYTKIINTALAADNQFTDESMWEAFQLVGHRPEMLRQIVGRVALNHAAGALSELLKKDALIWHGQLWDEFSRDFNALSPLQQVVLTLLLKQKQNWSPFSEESMSYYKQATQQEQLSISTVQTAIQALREQGFIWQSSRGQYALEDESFAEWFNHFEKNN